VRRRCWRFSPLFFFPLLSPSFLVFSFALSLRADARMSGGIAHKEIEIIGGHLAPTSRTPFFFFLSLFASRFRTLWFLFSSHGKSLERKKV